MPHIRVEIDIKAPPEVCFDMARDVQIHEQTTAGSKEKVVSLIRNGKESVGQTRLLELGDVVTFEAAHLGIRQRLTSKIVAFDRPSEFTDEMQRGAFRSLRHIHRFEPIEGGTKMIDVLDFESPAWIFGSIANRLFLTGYMKRFLEERGRALKVLAEGTLVG